MKNTPKYEINQKVYKFPKFNFEFKFTPSKIKRRVIDEIADGIVDIQYYIDNEIEPIEERKLFANEKELALILVLKLNTVINELKDKYGLVENPTMVHNKPISTKPENNKIPEESEEEMRKQGYYKNEKGEWEWDRNLAVSEEYAEEMQEMKRLDGYYDTSTLSKDESIRLHSLTKEYGLRNSSEAESDYAALDKLVNFICERFEDLGLKDPLNNTEVNKFITEFLDGTIRMGIHSSVSELIMAIAREAIKIIKR